jgi:GNAT superfamily N-acetyltransferase
MATNYNYPYYPPSLEARGYVKDTDWMEYEMTVPQQGDEKIAKAARLVMQRYNLHLLPARSKNDFLPYAKDIFALLEEAYRALYGVMPLSQEQVQTYIDQYFGLAIAEYVPLVLDADNKLVAFGVVFPSFSKALQKGKGLLLPFGFIHLLHALKHNERADLYLVGVKDEYLGKGVNAILMNQIMNSFIKNGVKKVESNPELETNQNVQTQWKYFERRQHKRRRCYIKQLA